ncbi:MAG: hypothetical protein AAGA17_00270 [Actinomycetota bacterium]
MSDPLDDLMKQAEENANRDYAPAMLLAEGQRIDFATLESIDWKQPDARPNGTLPPKFPIVTGHTNEDLTSTDREGRQVAGRRWAVHLNCHIGREAIQNVIDNGGIDLRGSMGIKRLTDKPNPHGGNPMRNYIVAHVRTSSPQPAAQPPAQAPSEDPAPAASEPADPNRPF